MLRAYRKTNEGGASALLASRRAMAFLILLAIGLPLVSPASESADPRMYIQEYRVKGAHQLSRAEIEEAVYPYLGPGRTKKDVEQARAALEKAYQAKGFQTVSVQVPVQQGVRGVIVLQVTEIKVGRLRVHGSRYFSPDDIKAMAPSLAEGKVVNFNDVNRDIVTLNQLPDRRVTPTLHAGVTPGTVDIDLDVKDTPPLHGSLELNNRYSPDTTPLRLNGSISYNNLWQLGHSIGFSFQLSPQDIEEVKVFTGYYLARIPNVDWLSLLVQGTKQDSNVATLGSLASGGRGETIGARAIISLPGGKDFYDSLSLGLDYKRFDQNVTATGGGTVTQTSYYYYPLSTTYSGTWMGKQSQTELNAGVNFNLRGTGSDPAAFENSRYKSEGNYVYLRGDLSHTHDLPAGFQVFGKAQGQVSDQPLVSGEQFGAGGLGTVRGYLEGEQFGDDAAFGSLELRSPSLLGWMDDKAYEWRIYVFNEGGLVTIIDPLPEQTSQFELASYGVGSRVRLMDHFNGSIDAGVPLIKKSETKKRDLLLTFRLWADF